MAGMGIGKATQGHPANHLRLYDGGVENEHPDYGEPNMDENYIKLIN